MQSKKRIFWKSLVMAVLVFCVLPNIVFWLISPRVYLVRGIFVLEYFFIGSLYPFISKKLFFVLWILFALYDLMFSTSSLFFMDFFEILHAIAHPPAVGLWDVLTWGSILLMFIFVTWLLVWIMVKFDRSIPFLKPRYLIPVAFGLLVFDFLNGGSPLRNSTFKIFSIQSNIISTPSLSFIMSIKYAISKDVAGPGSRISYVGSISKQIFENTPDSRSEKKQLLVLVESWGLLNNKALHREIIEPIYELADSKLYQIREGVTTYKYFTQAAELREITGYLMPSSLSGDSLAKHHSIFFKKQQQGYHVVGLHGYASAFYDRRNWWPALGIQEAYFAEKFKSFGMPICGNQFFRSVCDTAIASWIFAYARRNPERKEFFYWVTVNTHLPLEERKEEEFRAFHEKWKKAGVDAETLRLCYEFRALFADFARKCSDSLSPKMHVLLIGDHAPPYIDPDLRKLFSATQVPYLELIPIK